MIRFRELTVRTIRDQGKDDYREAELRLEDKKSLFTAGLVREETLLIAEMENGIE